MSWKQLLTREIDDVYGATEKLFDLVDDSELDWKPATGDNWMTTAQLLRHIADGCGPAFRGLITGDWGMPPDMDPSQMKPEDMLPPAEKMPAVASVGEARRMFAEDKTVTIKLLQEIAEDDLANKPAPVPWDPAEMILGHRMLQMVDHVNQHKGQLYYYLKLQGKPVNTHHLYGI